MPTRTHPQGATLGGLSAGTAVSIDARARTVGRLARTTGPIRAMNRPGSRLDTRPADDLPMVQMRVGVLARARPIVLCVAVFAVVGGTGLTARVASASPVAIDQAFSDVDAGSGTAEEQAEVDGFARWVAQDSGQGVNGSPWSSSTAAGTQTYTDELAGRTYTTGSSGGYTSTTPDYTTGDAATTANGGEAALVDAAPADVAVTTEAGGLAVDALVAPGPSLIGRAILSVPVIGEGVAAFGVGFGIGTVVRHFVFGGFSHSQPAAPAYRAVRWDYVPNWASNWHTRLPQFPLTPSGYPADSYVFYYETPYPTANEWNTTVPQAGDQGACDAQSGSSFPPPPLEPAAVQASGPQSGWPACGNFVAYYIPSAAVRQGALTNSGANVVVQPPALPALSSVIHVLAQHLGEPAYKELRDWANAQIGVPGATTPAGPQRVEIPQPQTNETYDDYAARLDDLGLTHHTRHTLGADTADLDQPPTRSPWSRLPQE
jgi:hypothetical protein